MSPLATGLRSLEVVGCVKALSASSSLPYSCSSPPCTQPRGYNGRPRSAVCCGERQPRWPRVLRAALPVRTSRLQQGIATTLRSVRPSDGILLPRAIFLCSFFLFFTFLFLRREDSSRTAAVIISIIISSSVVMIAAYNVVGLAGLWCQLVGSCS